MKGYIYSEQIPMFGHKDIIGYGTDDFYVIEIPKQISKDIIKSLPELRKSFEKYSEEIKINK